MLAIRASQLFDGSVFADGPRTVFVDGGRIVGVEPGFPQVGQQWTVIDCGDATVLPGLIDTHVHLVADSGDRALDRVAAYSDTEIVEVIENGLRRQLAAGVTTVRDLGDRSWAVVERRDRQRSTPTSGPSACPLEPTILASGPPVTSPGGHCHYLGGEVEDRRGMAAAIRERAERGVDIVKIMASGGMATPGTDVMRTQFSRDDLAFLVDEAHAVGLPVTAHAHGLPAVEQALEVGVDGIEHCSCLTETGVQITDDLLRTLSSRQLPIGAALGNPPAVMYEQAPPAVKAMMERAGITPEAVRAVRLDAVGRMYRAGVRFVAGADSGIHSWAAHGQIHESVSFLVAAGASTVDAVTAATSAAAHACGLAGRKGEVKPGLDADILVVDGDLKSDITRLQHVRAVIVSGRLLT